MKKKKILITLFIILLLAIVAFICVGYYKVMQPLQNKESAVIYIEDESDFETVVSQLKPLGLPSEKIFTLLSDKMKYTDNVKSGRYVVSPGTTMISLIRNLRSGRQTPVNVTFNNIRLLTDLSEAISPQLMFKGEELHSLLSDSLFVSQYGFTTENFSSMFIPNTYQIYWNSSAKSFVDRMKREYDIFWSESRRDRAKLLKLSPIDVAVIASIVEEECSVYDEYPTVAGLYLNRIKRGMRLEADPTVKYAVGDFSLKRVLNVHLAHQSPYNTYLNDGLPPGPIRIASIRAIDSVLDANEHNYIFMCAKEDFSGRHNFATNLRQHNINAQRYRQALNRNKIY